VWPKRERLAAAAYKEEVIKKNRIRKGGGRRGGRKKCSRLNPSQGHDKTLEKGWGKPEGKPQGKLKCTHQKESEKNRKLWKNKRQARSYPPERRKEGATRLGKGSEGSKLAHSGWGAVRKKKKTRLSLNETEPIRVGRKGGLPKGKRRRDTAVESDRPGER